MQPLSSQTQRLPVNATIASLISFVALYLSLGNPTLLALLGLTLLASYVIDTRLEVKSRVTQFIRFTLYAFVLIPSYSRFTGDSGDPAELVMAHVVAQLCACELVVQAWLRRPTGGQRGAITVLLSSLTMMGASNTFILEYIRFLVPAFMLFLALSLRDFRAVDATEEKPHWITQQNLAPALGDRMRRWSWAALLVAITTGAFAHNAVLLYRNEISQLGMKLIGERQDSLQATGISTSPSLGDTSGATGSLTRMLRIEGSMSEPYLRVMAFDLYRNGRWLPNLESRDFNPLPAAKLNPTAAGHRARITRLVDDNNLIFTPLHIAGLAASNGSQFEWSTETGGPVRSVEPAPYPFIYEVILNDKENHQGPLCLPPTPKERQSYLQVPDTLAPEVRLMAQQVSQEMTGSLEKAAAVQEYLMSNHSYSLSTQAGAGDPISNFLLQRKSAHCEYFASAATILLRCMSVPTRYVIGYLAHEPDGPNGTVVRGRDAHAWAESWIEGVGWIIVDATPGGGRPDQTAQSLPFWTKVSERLQDVIGALRSVLSGLLKLPPALIVGVGVLVLAGLAWRRWASRRHETETPAFSYSNAAHDLVEYGNRFEQVLQRSGVPCPSQRTWHEHVELLAQDETQATPLKLDTAQAFLDAYNNARFGHLQNGKAAGEVSQLLQELENR